MPVTATLPLASAINTLRYSDTLEENTFIHRLCYSSQLLIARKFSNALSFAADADLGTSEPRSENYRSQRYFFYGGIKLTNRVSLSAEYYYLLPNQISNTYVNA